LSYVEKHLIPGESVQYQTKLHWIVMLGHIAIAAFLGLLGMAFLIARLTAAKAPPPSNVMYLVALFCLMLGAVIFCVGLLQRNATEMAVTNKRVIAKRGLVDRRAGFRKVAGIWDSDRARHGRDARNVRKNLPSPGTQRTSPAADRW